MTITKTHLIVNGAAICRSTIKLAGRQGATTRKGFTTLASVEQCSKCAALLTRIPVKG